MSPLSWTLMIKDKILMLAFVRTRIPEVNVPFRNCANPSIRRNRRQSRLKLNSQKVPNACWKHRHQYRSWFSTQHCWKKFFRIILVYGIDKFKTFFLSSMFRGGQGYKVQWVHWTFMRVINKHLLRHYSSWSFQLNDKMCVCPRYIRCLSFPKVKRFIFTRDIEIYQNIIFIWMTKI